MARPNLIQKNFCYLRPHVLELEEIEPATLWSQSMSLLVFDQQNSLFLRHFGKTYRELVARKIGQTATDFALALSLFAKFATLIGLSSTPRFLERSRNPADLICGFLMRPA